MDLRVSYKPDITGTADCKLQSYGIICSYLRRAEFRGNVEVSDTAVIVCRLGRKVFYVNMYRRAGYCCFDCLHTTKKVIKETPGSDPLLHKQSHTKRVDSNSAILLREKNCFFQYSHLVDPVIIDLSVEIDLLGHFNILSIETFVCGQVYFIKSCYRNIRVCIKLYRSNNLLAPVYILFINFQSYEKIISS